MKYQSFDKTKIIIFSGLILFILLSLWISYFSSFSTITKDLFVNLSAGGLASLFTIFGIDLLIQRSNEAKWAEAKKTAQSDMIYLTNMLASHFEIPLGFKIIDYQVDDQNIEENARKILRSIIDEILKRDMQKLLEAMTTDTWGQLLLNLFLMRQSLTEASQLYISILPPEILGKLLAVRRSFQNFYFSFGLVPELFTKQQSEWPSNKGGVENNKSIRASLLNGFTKDLKQYFGQLKLLMTLIDEWK